MYWKKQFLRTVATFVISESNMAIQLWLPRLRQRRAVSWWISTLDFSRWWADRMLKIYRNQGISWKAAIWRNGKRKHRDKQIHILHIAKKFVFCSQSSSVLQSWNTMNTWNILTVALGDLSGHRCCLSMSASLGLTALQECQLYALLYALSSSCILWWLVGT